MTVDSDNACQNCGVNDWKTSPTMIECRCCGELWGLSNGQWVLGEKGTKERQAKIAQIRRMANQDLWKGYVRCGIGVDSEEDFARCHMAEEIERRLRRVGFLPTQSPDPQGGI